MRGWWVAVAVLLLPGCSSPSGTDDGPEPAPPAPVESSEWTVTGFLEPRGAMDVRFTVAEPTECRLAFFVQQAISGKMTTDHPAHIALWVDGSYWYLPSSPSTYSNWQYRVKAGPVDTRTAYDALLDVYYQVAYGKEGSFYEGIGLRQVPVEAEGRAVLSATDGLVNGTESVNQGFGGSMMASIECGAPVQVRVQEDPDAVWTNAAETGGDTAVEASVASAESGSLGFKADGNRTEAVIGSWGGVQGSLSLTGAVEESLTFSSTPQTEPEQRWFEGGTGDVHVEWQTIRLNGLWWVGLSSWEGSTAQLEPRGNWPFD